MTFRGYFTLDGVEIANSSRIAAHMGINVPTTDVGLLSSPDPTACGLTNFSPGLYQLPASSTFVSEGLWTVPDGSRRWDKGLLLVDGPCWGPTSLCSDAGCRSHIGYDDSWPGLHDLIGGDTSIGYRIELAPWYTTRIPESAEFGGIWVLDVKGLGPAPLSRTVTEMVGSGATASPYRDTSRKITFDALLIACTNAGLEYGLEWLTCQLRATNGSADAILQFLSAHPEYSSVDPVALMRQAHGVVLTQTPTITAQFLTGGKENQQSNIYRVSWELTALTPYLYMPPVTIPVDWDTIESEQISWVHAANCTAPSSCEPMPILFSADCVPETIDVVTSPPPSCGGCMPVCAVSTHLFQVPTQDYPLRCRETAVNMVITNTGTTPLTIQAYWRVCHSNTACEDNQFPVQIAGLPADASITLDSIAGRYFATSQGRVHRPVGIVATPNGAPWRPTIIDRSICWEFVVTAPGDDVFTITMTLSDRDA